MIRTTENVVAMAMNSTGARQGVDDGLSSDHQEPESRQSRPSLWLLIAGWVGAIAGLSIWLGRTSDGELRDELRHWQFWALEIQFLALLTLTWLNLPALLGSLALNRRDFTVPIAASAMAFALATFVAPRTSRIYYDEQIYQSVGQNLSDLRLAQMCNEGNLEYGSLQCWRGEYNKEPDGYPYLLSVAYRVTGVREGVASFLNTCAAALLVLVVFLVAAALTGNAEAGGYASIIAALVPEQLRWSHTAAAEPSAALACAFAVLASLSFVRTRSTRALMWTVVATVFAAEFRPESLLVSPVVLAVILLFAPAELRRARLWWAGLIGVALAAGHIGHLSAFGHEAWGASGPRISAAYFRWNLQSNGWFYLADWRFPALYTALALTALVLWRNARAIVVPVLYFLVFWGIFLFFYAGSYNYGADDRFSLMTYPPLAILAGVGVSKLSDLLRERHEPALVRFAITAALCVQFLWYLPLVRATGEEGWAARADVEFAKSLANELPRNSIVLTHNPNMFHVWGHSAAQASLATTEPGYVTSVLARRYAGGVFFHWNFWCNVADPLQQSYCTTLLSRFPHTLVREYRERDYRYALYRLEIKSTPANPRADVNSQ
jgi:4-amino-4-deoxy-L-arabinose transferase-like glycosyltransferase